jgi:hypothetical protein
MQVNSAQDALTKHKRRVLAKSYAATPPEQKDKTNALYASVVANGATQRERFVTPTVSAWGGVPGTATFSSDCCLTWNGVFSTVNTKDGVNRQALMPVGWRSVA